MHYAIRKALITALTTALFFGGLLTAIQEKKFVLLTASYNNAAYYKRNLDSVFAQTYKNWHIIYIDDISTDGTRELVPDYIKQCGFEDKVTFVANTEKCYCLKNYYREIHKLPDDCIVVTLDGDDALADNDALAYLNSIYADPNVWATYGNYRKDPPQNWQFRFGPFPQEIIRKNGFREYKWNVGHLRSFYAGLFKNIKFEDFMFQGKMLTTVEDVAYMFPILEQSGIHTRYIDKVLYIYNIGNPLHTNNVWKEDLRKNIETYIRKKKKYQPLAKPPYAKK